MRPVVKPGLRRMWRDPTTLQIGVDPRHAVVLTGVDGRTARLVSALDGTLDDTGVRLTAVGLGLDEAATTRLLRMLGEAHVLDDADDPAELPASERSRLAPDLAAMSLDGAQPGAARAALRRRRAASVRVSGCGRVGATIAGLIAAAGVGRVTVTDPGPARPADCSPGGIQPADAGSSRAQAARAAVHRASDSVRTTPGNRPPSLVVLAPVGAVTLGERDALLRSGTPHIFAGVREHTGIVGPLVLPGRTACLHCLDLHRCDRDGAWPVLAAQLAHPPDGHIEACGVALAAAVAAHTTLHALAFLDGAPSEQPPDTAVINGTLELGPPEWRLRRRSWPPHPRCGCRWAHDISNFETMET